MIFVTRFDLLARIGLAARLYCPLGRGSRKLLRPTPTRRKRCCVPRSTRSRSDKAMLVNSSQDRGRRGWGMAASENVEVAGLQFEDDGTCDA